MNRFIALAVAGVVSFGFASSAWAFKFSPPSTKFTATGSTSFFYPVHNITIFCTSVFKGKTNDTGKSARITSAVQSSSVDPLSCAQILATGLPWKVKTTSATTADILLMSNNGPLGVCGPGSVPVTSAAA